MLPIVLRGCFFADQLKELDCETRIVMEYTGHYYEPVAKVLHEAGLYVSAVNPLLIKEYVCNSLGHDSLLQLASK